MMKSEQASWYVLYCKHREELRASENLGGQGIDTFYPQINIEKLRGGRRSSKLEPLFPNYLFALLDPQKTNFNAVRSTRGVSHTVKFGAQLARVSDAFISQLRELNGDRAKSDNQPAVDTTLPQPGEKVIISRGAFRGLEAIYQCADGLERSVLMVKMLEQHSELIIDNNDFD